MNKTKKQDIDWNFYKFFLAIAREGSFSKAAKVLGVEHTTVSRKISDFEKSLQNHLFHRTKTGASLTEFGKQILTDANRIELQIEKLNEIKNIIGLKKNEVTISVPPHLLTYLIIPYIKDFNEENPEILLNFISDTRISDLFSAQTDLAIRMSKMQDSSLITKKIYSVGYSLYGEEKQNAEIALGNSFPDKELKTWSENYIRSKNKNLAVNDFGAMKEAIANNLGIGILPDFMARDKKVVKKKDILPKIKNSDVFIVYRKDSAKNPNIMKVKNFIIKVFNFHD